MAPLFSCFSFQSRSRCALKWNTATNRGATKSEVKDHRASVPAVGQVQSGGAKLAYRPVAHSIARKRPAAQRGSAASI